ncbi:MAG: hypothetical protein KGL39_21715 [Patescibacteria group bacterium]|nr:hypothetical protein [Patescibacteria group bacterium]
MQGIALGRIPGIQEAIAKARKEQALLREAAWKNLPTNICGFTVRMMTVSDYAVLDHYESPFLYRQAPNFAELALFLWALSPQCKAWNERRIQYGRSLSAFLYSRRVRISINTDEKFVQAVKACFKHVENMFFDSPPSSGRQGHGGCYLAQWFDFLQSEYRISDEEIWAMPLPQMFQRIRAIQLRKGVKLPEFNKVEDEVKQWVSSGISSGRFTYDDLAHGRVRFGEN